MSGTVENTDHFDTCHFGVRCPSVDAKLVSYTVDDTGFTPMTLEIHVPFRCPVSCGQCFTPGMTPKISHWANSETVEYFSLKLGTNQRCPILSSQVKSKHFISIIIQ